MGLNLSLSEILIFLGLFIAVVDIFTTGYIFPFAIALFFTGVISIFIQSTTLLTVIFTFQLILYYYLFFKFIKKQKTEIDEEKIGFVKRKENNYYIVDFPTGFKGEIQWKAISKEDLGIGDKVKVKSIDGNILIVEKV
ncbi:MAG: hypothetical protein DSY59_03860 [Persephonella sp.]|nr:MAG: hypothetical protein DSY60_01660 [Persephonella sp.]RUM59848.1 MAG: hypothetical protein DSY59_03860 [Persephonella sp.]